jgi:alpha-tubulin suppressor-like RCC1 family protein
MQKRALDMRWTHGAALAAVLLGCAPEDAGEAGRASEARAGGERAEGRVAIGDEHACAVRGDGRVECWGRNDRGQLGVAGGDRRTPAWVSATYQVDRVVGLAAGSKHTCALRADGAVYCWGDDAYGQLGNGSAPSEPVGGGFTPVRVTGLARVVQIAAGGETTCAVVAAGGVHCWGRNHRGQLGTAMPEGVGSHLPVFVQLGPVMGPEAVEVGVGRAFACARSASGKVACWGDNAARQVTIANVATSPTARAPSVFTAAQLAVGDAHACVRTPAGGLACWGAFGTPSPMPTGVARVAAGRDYACVIEGGGETRCWGRAGAPALGFGWSWSASQSRLLGGLNVGLFAGPANACVESVAGELRCLGANARGQVGDGTTAAVVDSPAAVARATPSDVEGISVGWAHTCARRRDGRMVCWGDNSRGQIQTPASATPALAPVETRPLGFARVVAGWFNTWMLSWTGTAWSQGAVQSGESGFGDPNGTWRVVAFDTGLSHSCAVSAAGTVLCRGADGFGQLGVGTAPRPAGALLTAWGVTDAVDVATGLGHSCALRANGRVSCWGFNGNGQLGDGTTIDRAAPVDVAGLTDAAALTAGAFFTCALRAGGSVSCWGFNGFGQLGDGTTVDRATPAAAAGLSNVMAIDAGVSHACAVMGDGDVRCWGDNSEGAVGVGTAVSAYPTPLSLHLTDVTAVSAGGATSCALGRQRRLIDPNAPLTSPTVDFTLKCWGRNDRGQVGDGTTVLRRSPVNTRLQ